MAECRREVCTCTSDEMSRCLNDQWNEFDRPKEALENKKNVEEFEKVLILLVDRNAYQDESEFWKNYQKLKDLFPRVSPLFDKMIDHAGLKKLV